MAIKLFSEKLNMERRNDKTRGDMDPKPLNWKYKHWNIHIMRKFRHDIFAYQLIEMKMPVDAYQPISLHTIDHGVHQHIYFTFGHLGEKYLIGLQVRADAINKKVVGVRTVNLRQPGCAAVG